MYILGISCYYHDAAAALLHDGLLVAAAEEERFTRKKHDSGFPDRAIDFCLCQAGITRQDLDCVVFYEKPLLKFERILLTTLQTFPRSANVFRESMISWFNEKLWIKGRLLTRLDIPDEKLLFVDHHLSHAASAFFCAPCREAAILTVDGVGEWTTATVGRGRALWPQEANTGPATGLEEAPCHGNSIELLDEIKFPHSLGLLYSAFTAFLGFEVNEGEYKVMGMAPYGQPRRVEDVYRLIEVNSDGAFCLNMGYFCFHNSTSRTFNEKFVALFGEPRARESAFYTVATHPKRDHPAWDDSAARRNQDYADIAASIQCVTEQTLLKMADYAHRRTGLKALCMAGGVALNSVANGRILRESPFEEIFIQPAAGDSGGALGAALYAYHVLLGQPRMFTMEHAYWGQGYTPDQVLAAIEAKGWPCELLEAPERLAERMVDDLLSGKVISLFQGRFEWGPRALGNRSILADVYRLPKLYPAMISFLVVRSYLVRFVVEKLLVIQASTSSDSIEREVSRLGLALPEFAESVETTTRIMAMVKRRAGSIPVVTFECDITSPRSSAVLRQISQDLSLPFIEEVDEVLTEAKETKAPIYVADGAHWHEAGHALLASTISQALRARFPWLTHASREETYDFLAHLDEAGMVCELPSPDMVRTDHFIVKGDQRAVLFAHPPSRGKPSLSSLKPVPVPQVTIASTGPGGAYPG